MFFTISTSEFVNAAKALNSKSASLGLPDVGEGFHIYVARIGSRPVVGMVRQILSPKDQNGEHFAYHNILLTKGIRTEGSFENEIACVHFPKLIEAIKGIPTKHFPEIDIEVNGTCLRISAQGNMTITVPAYSSEHSDVYRMTKPGREDDRETVLLEDGPVKSANGRVKKTRCTALAVPGARTERRLFANAVGNIADDIDMIVKASVTKPEHEFRYDGDMGTFVLPVPPDKYERDQFKSAWVGFDGYDLNMTCTDGHRLVHSVWKATEKQPRGESFDVSVHLHLLKVVGKACGNRIGVTRLESADALAFRSVGTARNHTLIVRAHRQTGVNDTVTFMQSGIKRIQSPSGGILISRDGFKAALSVLMPATKLKKDEDVSEHVVMAFNQRKRAFVFAIVKNNSGEIVSSIDVPFSGRLKGDAAETSCALMFNPKYLLEAFNTVFGDTSDVLVTATGPDDPTFFKSQTGSMVIVMPVSGNGPTERAIKALAS